MKLCHFLLLYLAFATSFLWANPADDHERAQKKRTPEETKQALQSHKKGAEKLSLEQDDLSADVQDLIDEQTDPQVIKLLSSTEEIMAEVIDLLEESNTDGSTIAIQTEIIEKIFDAAKKKKQGSGKGKENQKNMDSMLEMMKNMMEGGKDVGKKPGQGKPGKGEGGGGGGKGSGSSQGKTGSPDNSDESGVRRVPKSSGNSGGSLPREFQNAMDAYNKGLKN